MDSHRAELTRTAVALFALLLAACGGGTSTGGTSAPVATYSVGGTLTGLDASNSITLTNNLTDNLTLSGASNVNQTQTFAFATKLPSGASYSVAVSGVAPTAQPCTSTYGAGVINGDNVPGYYSPGISVFCGQPNGLSTFTSAGSMTTVRYNHTATLLPSGKVLVVDGQGAFGGTALASAELYDPVSGTWKATTNPPSVPRYSHTATLLRSAKVLVSGGYNGTGVLNSVDLFDSATGNWASTTGSLNVPRYNHTATLLPSGKVLVSGGQGASAAALGSAELYDPATGSWTYTGSLNVPRYNHTATLLPNGKVLVSGGLNSGLGGGSLAGAELYDPATGKWTYTGPLETARYSHTATLLPSGKVLVNGGYSTTTAFALANAELYDPATGSWTYTGSLATARYNHTATLLPNGQVLVSAGQQSSLGAATNSAELYDPVAGSWTKYSAGPLTTARANHTATLLLNGKVLVSGGQDTAVPIGSAELYF